MKLSLQVCLVIGVVGAAACADPDPSCIEGVCPNWDEARTLPGPCRSAQTEGYARTDYEYDAAGRVTRAGSLEFNADLERRVFYGAEWAYDDAGAVTDLSTYYSGYPAPVVSDHWVFGPDQVNIKNGGIVRVYDRALFSFLPLFGGYLRHPRAELGLLRSSITQYEWTVDGNRRIRRELPNGPSKIYELDDRGRIVVIDGQTVYEFDGDHLIRNGDLEWTYDLGGNVIEGRRGADYREVYSYECW